MFLGEIGSRGASATLSLQHLSESGELFAGATGARLLGFLDLSASRFGGRLGQNLLKRFYNFVKLVDFTLSQQCKSP